MNLGSPVQDVAEPAGLSDAEAAARLAAEGFNEIARQRKRTALHIALDWTRLSVPGYNHRYEAVGFVSVASYQAPGDGPVVTEMWRKRR